MEAVFERLRVRREAKELQERQTAETLRQAKEREEGSRRAQVQAAAHCSEKVLRVLSQLQQAAYPLSQVRWHGEAHDNLRDSLRGLPAWSVGHTDVYWATDSRHELAWYADVLVRLECDEQNRPLSLTCVRVPGVSVRTWFGTHYVEPRSRCGLSEEALVGALSQLYPARELFGARV